MGGFVARVNYWVGPQKACQGKAVRKTMVFLAKTSTVAYVLYVPELRNRHELKPDPPSLIFPIHCHTIHILSSLDCPQI